MLHSKYNLLIVLVLSMVCFSLVASATEVTFWAPFTGPDGEVIDQMVKDFNETTGKENDVKINMLIVPWSDYYTKLTVSMPSGQAPDLAIAHSDRIAGYAEEGALREVGSSVLKSLGIKEEDYIAALWKAGEIEGKRYALPIDAFPRHLYYNKTLFEKAGLDPNKAPKNLEEVIEFGKKIDALGDDIYGLYFDFEGSGRYRDFFSYYYQFNDELLTEDNKQLVPNFAEVATKVLQIHLDFINKYEISPKEAVDYGALLAQDRLGIAISQITELAKMEQAEGLEFGVGVMPQFGDQKAVFALGHNFILPKTRKQSDEKLEASTVFIDWFAKHSLEWAKGGKVPASFNTLNDEGFKELEIQSIVASQLEYMKTPPLVAEMPKISSIVADNVELVYAGQISIEKAVENIVDKVNSELSK